MRSDHAHCRPTVSRRCPSALRSPRTPIFGISWATWQALRPPSCGVTIGFACALLDWPCALDLACASWRRDGSDGFGLARCREPIGNPKKHKSQTITTAIDLFIASLELCVTARDGLTQALWEAPGEGARVA